MTLNYIWVGFLLVGFVVGLIRVLGYYYRDFFADALQITFSKADLNVFKSMFDSTFTSAETSISIVIYLIGIMTLWLGIMRVAERGGAIEILSKLVNPFFCRLFPELPKNHPAFGSMIMNISANMLSLDNAATPMGLKAMEELQEANPKSDTASNAQIMFLVLNTSGLTVIPVTVMAYRAAEGAANPSDIFVPILIATYFSTVAGLVAVAIRQRINLMNAVVLGYLGGGTAIIASIIYFVNQMDQEQIGVFTTFSGTFIIMSVITFFMVLAVKKRINVYEAFIEGAKEGFQVAVTIIPYLVAMLFAIGIFRASGAMDILLDAIRFIVVGIGVNADFVEALPTAMMKPLSGSGARGMMIEAMQTYGADSFTGRLASTFQGSTETTFYTLAVYYGAVNIQKTRYTVTCGLIADLAGIIAAIFICYQFFYTA
ncbi:nucleoside recognition domain-containing protein [Fulvivirgaceae bacterium BMA10]|uniref:Nucleoside recognition domain-containing protein n=1 Tax=Splendidivirga corallicola TaxID=3051826 RepID=A0ABT8KKT6_9BACT|nr:nucleoside recognition domain-containing protein [Fulvivirgaceae bacterium BMA10]